MWFSPDGKHLAFATFNDTNVKEIVIPKYGTPGSIEDQYPSEQKIKYPKVIKKIKERFFATTNLSDGRVVKGTD